ncbi:MULTISPECIES: hypothetical protein [Roseomonadaceae]|uniref:Uncharacterized protein n=1 Tax=Falsiroseomonas oleicola TaxID=2801474 RepID=A0ABS6HD21_9PROT|nr:hypothetical protein [Roseomonas oleicola]MBU8545215.1 hypothetical protein [Roseomonas oleicola]
MSWVVVPQWVQRPASGPAAAGERRYVQHLDPRGLGDCGGGLGRDQAETGQRRIQHPLEQGALAQDGARRVAAKDGAVGRRNGHISRKTVSPSP